MFLLQELAISLHSQYKSNYVFCFNDCLQMFFKFFFHSSVWTRLPRINIIRQKGNSSKHTNTFARRWKLSEYHGDHMGYLVNNTDKHIVITKVPVLVAKGTQVAHLLQITSQLVEPSALWGRAEADLHMSHAELRDRHLSTTRDWRLIRTATAEDTVWWQPTHSVVYTHSSSIPTPAACTLCLVPRLMVCA